MTCHVFIFSVQLLIQYFFSRTRYKRFTLTPQMNYRQASIKFILVLINGIFGITSVAENMTRTGTPTPITIIKLWYDTYWYTNTRAALNHRHQSLPLTSNRLQLYFTGVGPWKKQQAWHLPQIYRTFEV